MDWYAKIYFCQNLLSKLILYHQCHKNGKSHRQGRGRGEGEDDRRRRYRDKDPIKAVAPLTTPSNQQCKAVNIKLLILMPIQGLKYLF